MFISQFTMLLSQLGEAVKRLNVIILPVTISVPQTFVCEIVSFQTVFEAVKTPW